ncbi:MAG: efflux transporter outer membrane subunit [Luteolibacter sp.]
MPIRSFHRFPLRLSVAPVLAALGLTACVDFGKPGVSSVQLPQEWKNAAGLRVAEPSRDLSRWWGRFGDPIMTRLVTTSLNNSLDVKTSMSRVREARARRESEASSLFPSLSGSVGSSASSTLRKNTADTSAISYSTGLNASWEVDLFGKQRTSLLASGADINASVENLHTVQASLASEVALAYLDFRSAQARLQVVRDSLKSREETYQLTVWRQKAGQIDQLDLRQAETSLEQARASIPALEQSIAQSKNRLALLAGQTPGSFDSLLDSSSRAIPNPPSDLAIGIPADTVRQRPDVRSAAHQWVAAVHRTRAAKLERLPNLNLSGSLGINAANVSKLFNPQVATTGLVAGLSGPIFDAGRIRANIEAQNEAEEQALLAYSSTVLQALSDVEDSLIACRRTAERIALLEKATVAAREASTLANQRYKAGVVDLNTVLDAQRTELGLEESLVSAKADRSSAYVQLYKALGGGWSANS